LEEVEVGSVLYRTDKAPGRFFDNQRNAREIADPEIVAIDDERSFEFFLYVQCFNESKSEKKEVLWLTEPLSS